MIAYYDLVNRKQIKEAIDIQHKCNNESGTFYGKTLDEAVDLWKNKAIKTDALIPTLQLYRDNADLLSGERDIALLDALISHPENDRLRLIGDGSYYTHRIWGHITYEGKIEFYPEIDHETQRSDSAFARMRRQLDERTPAEQVDYLFNTFEVVYIQIPIEATEREQIERIIQWEMFDRKSDYYMPDF